jgi:hypothetical protein
MTWSSRCDRNLAISNDVTATFGLPKLTLGSSRRSHSRSFSYQTTPWEWRLSGARARSDRGLAKDRSPPTLPSVRVITEVGFGATPAIADATDNDEVAPKADLALRSSDDFTEVQGIRGSDVEAAVCRSRPPVDKLRSTADCETLRLIDCHSTCYVDVALAGSMAVPLDGSARSGF